MTEDLLIVRVAGERMAMAATAVQSVIELDRVVPIPLAPVPIAGLATQRSRTLTVIDVAKALELDDDAGVAGYAVVAEVEGVGYALAVDAVENVLPALGEIQPPRTKLSPGWARSAIGMIETSIGTVLQVDLTRLIGGPVQQKAA